MATMEHAATEKAKLTQVAGNVTGTLWCGYHQGYANASTGRYQERNGKRWMVRQLHGDSRNRKVAEPFPTLEIGSRLKR